MKVTLENVIFAIVCLCIIYVLYIVSFRGVDIDDKVKKVTTKHSEFQKGCPSIIPQISWSGEYPEKNPLVDNIDGSYYNEDDEHWFSENYHQYDPNNYDKFGLKTKEDVHNYYQSRIEDIINKGRKSNPDLVALYRLEKNQEGPLYSHSYANTENYCNNWNWDSNKDGNYSTCGDGWERDNNGNLICPVGNCTESQRVIEYNNEKALKNNTYRRQLCYKPCIVDKTTGKCIKK